jgi:ADP-ribose pyrophosphatase
VARKPLEDWKIISSRYSFQDRWVKVRSDKVLLPTGRTLDPYHAVEVPDGVNIIPITDTGNILLVEQYRHVVGRTVLEIPAGHIDAGEEPEAAGRRELLEETGYASENWHDLGALFSGASRLTSQFRSFLALDVRKVTEPALAEIRIHELPWNEFVGGLLKQPLMDASQMASLLLLFLYVGSSNNPRISSLKLP